jgi:hypothetical protein
VEMSDIVGSLGVGRNWTADERCPDFAPEEPSNVSGDKPELTP